MFSKPSPCILKLLFSFYNPALTHTHITTTKRIEFSLEYSKYFKSYCPITIQASNLFNFLPLCVCCVFLYFSIILFPLMWFLGTTTRTAALFYKLTYIHMLSHWYWQNFNQNLKSSTFQHDVEYIKSTKIGCDARQRREWGRIIVAYIMI